MLLGIARPIFVVEIACLIVLYTSCAGVRSKAYHKNDQKTHNKTTDKQEEKNFRQKKPRSAQIGFLPRYQTVDSRQSVPVRLSSVPASSYRLPGTGIQRLSNVGSLTRYPALQQTYVPVVASLPSVRYPTFVSQAGLGGRYVIPYGLKIPPSGLSTFGTDNEVFSKHYNEKYNTLPSISGMDLDQASPNLKRKVENKKIDLDDDFDHFLDSLGNVFYGF